MNLPLLDSEMGQSAETADAASSTARNSAGAAPAAGVMVGI